MAILIIDDETSLRRSVRAYLEDDDYEVLEAENGQQGIELVQAYEEDIEAVILDLNMPIMNGFSFLPVFVEMLPDVPVIVLSGVGVVEDAIKAIKLGAWDFVTKPLLDFELMTLAIERALEKAELLKFKRQYLAELEKAVEIRTAELNKSKETAEKASAAKSNFLMNMSHEFRTPLNQIIGFCQILLEKEIDPEQHDDLKIILASSRKLHGILEGILKLAALESKSVEFESRSFSLGAELKRLEGDFSSMVASKGLDFHMDIPDDLPPSVYGPPAEIVQTITNVLFNALQYTRQGFIAVNVAVADKKDEKVTVHITVTDTGVGISEEKLETIFDSFEIGEEVIRKDLAGAGIGLTISKLTLEKLGGEIHATSSPAGSVFHISLPLDIANSP
jgi:signal transduction histidine kinase